MVRKRVCKGKYFILKSFSGHIEFCIRLQPTDCFASFLHSLPNIWITNPSPPQHRIMTAHYCIAQHTDSQRVAKRPILGREMGCFAAWNGPFHTAIRPISQHGCAGIGARHGFHDWAAWDSWHGGAWLYGVVVCRLYCAAMCIYGVRQSLFSVFYANFASDQNLFTHTIRSRWNNNV